MENSKTAQNLNAVLALKNGQIAEQQRVIQDQAAQISSLMAQVQELERARSNEAILTRSGSVALLRASQMGNESDPLTDLVVNSLLPALHETGENLDETVDMPQVLALAKRLKEVKAEMEKISSILGVPLRLGTLPSDLSESAAPRWRQST